MPNEILNIQHTIIQLQNIEKVQSVGQQREQYQQKQEAMHLQAKREMEQTIVRISEEAEKVFLNEERQNNDREGGKQGYRDREKENKETAEDGDRNIVDIIV